MNTTPRTTRAPRRAFTLIEAVIAIAVSAIILSGLSAAILVASRAVPTPSEVGTTDQQVIDTLNRFRSELRLATEIQMEATAAGVQFSLTINAPSVDTAPSSIVYRYKTSDGTLSRKQDSDTEKVYLTGLSDVDANIASDNGRVNAVVIRFKAEGTIQNSFEFIATLPNNPELK